MQYVSVLRKFPYANLQDMKQKRTNLWGFGYLRLQTTEMKMAVKKRSSHSSHKNRAVFVICCNHQ
jgi:hypothetical protein